MTEFVLRSLDNNDRPRSLKDIVIAEAREVTNSRSYSTMSAQWNREVHGGHSLYIGQLADKEIEDEKECDRGLRMLARWWIQVLTRVTSEQHRDLFLLGGEDRISIKWFFDWVEHRLESPLEEFIRDVFEQLVFGQHIRVALSRFDGRNQRLRFVLGDDGIIPTRSAKDKLTNGIPGWTADRLWSFTRLLCDLSVLEEDSNGGMRPGELAGAVK